MKSYIVLLGCLVLVNSAYSSTESSPSPSCPVQPKTCFHYRDAVDYQSPFIGTAEFIADVTFREDKCFGRMHIHKVHYDVLGQLNGTELRVALYPDCLQQYKWQPNEKFCLVVDVFRFEHKMITLDENVLLVEGPCALTPRPQRQTFSRVLPNRVLDTSNRKPNYMRPFLRSLVHRMAFEKGPNSLKDYYGSPFKKADSCTLRPATCPVCREWIDEQYGKKILDYSDIIEATFEKLGIANYKLNVSSVIKSSSSGSAPLADVYNFVLNYKCYDICPELDVPVGMLILMKEGGTRADGCLAIDDKLLIVPHVQRSMFELKSFLYASDETWAKKQNPV